MKKRRIVIDKNLVFRQVDALSYKFGEGGAGDRIQSDSSEGLDGVILSSMLSLRASMLRKRLKFCLAPVLDGSADNTSSLEGRIVFNLVLPEGFDDNDLDGVAVMIHEYLVRGVLADWLSSIGAEQQSGFAGDAQVLEGQIIDALRGPSVIRHPSLPYYPSPKIR